GLDRLDQGIALRGAEVGPAEAATPVAEHDVDAVLLHGRDAVDRLRARNAQRAHAPALDLLGEFAQPRHTGGDVPADDRGNRFAAALERHVVDLGGVGADGLRGQTDEDVIGAAGGSAAP